MLSVNHVRLEALRLAGCGERAVLSSPTATQWDPLFGRKTQK